jgi:hypothetical protein
VGIEQRMGEQGDQNGGEPSAGVFPHRSPPTAQSQPENGSKPGEDEEGMAEAAMHGEVLHRSAVVKEDVQIREGAEKCPDPGGFPPLSGRNQSRGATGPKGDLGKGIHVLES